MKSTDIYKLVISIVACQAAGGIGSIFTTPAISTWYAALEKPAFTPPNWVFAPVWITLYLLMGVAAFLVWRKGLNERGVKTALVIFLVQLILNALWSVVFFGLKSPMAGVILIVLLWIAILITIIRFFKLSHIAGGLLIPYIVWVSIAANLNVGIWMLNP
jgi:tryptophan-rich sensory protein